MCPGSCSLPSRVALSVGRTVNGKNYCFLAEWFAVFWDLWLARQATNCSTAAKNYCAEVRRQCNCSPFNSVDRLKIRCDSRGHFHRLSRKGCTPSKRNLGPRTGHSNRYVPQTGRPAGLSRAGRLSAAIVALCSPSCPLSCSESTILPADAYHWQASYGQLCGTAAAPSRPANKGWQQPSTPAGKLQASLDV